MGDGVPHVTPGKEVGRMRIKYLDKEEAGREGFTAFLGLNRGPDTAAGEFSTMENLCSDGFPALMTRPKRLKCRSFTAPRGLYGHDGLLYVDGTSLYYNGALVGEVEDSEKQFAAMGAYVLIFPDKVVFNTQDLTVKPMDHAFTTVADTVFDLTDREGTAIAHTAGSEPPASPANGAYWLDTGGNVSALKQYSAYSQSWVEVTQPYVRIGSPGIGTGFSPHDGVTISGAEDGQFNGDFIVHNSGPDFLVVTGLIDQIRTQAAPLTVKREAPDMDFFAALNNRVWGCSSHQHEIYACRLGDPFNWRAYEGLSTDSYAATVGSPGDFTGAAAYLGMVLFFKEQTLHKLYGSEPENFQLTELAQRGVQKGCEKSLALVNEILYYKSPGGVMAYDGTLPIEVGRALGPGPYTGAAAGSFGSKYYLSMADGSGACHLFVYDTLRRLWHREDSAKVLCFAALGTDLYFLRGDDSTLCALTRGESVFLFPDAAAEGYIPWMAETVDITAEAPEFHYTGRVGLRMSLSPGAAVSVSVCYDNAGDWQTLFETSAQGEKRVLSVPVIPRRCESFRLRIGGMGTVRLHGLSYVTYRGSEYTWPQ